MERLDCLVKEYAWGKKGAKSEVARLFAAGHRNFVIGKQTPYAELWMGTHPDGPAIIRQSNECLSNLIARNLNNNNNNNNNNNTSLKYEEVHLPFIMKIMSIQHTLSLQVHPTKEQAIQLHKKDPEHYPDRNHKPELAFALTQFELLCGFRPAEQIVENMRAFPELRNVMGVDNCQKFERLAMQNVDCNQKSLKHALRLCFATMLEKQVEEPKFIEEQLKSLYRRLDSNVRGCLIEETIFVMRDTYKRFPTDVGCFAPLYVNHMILKPGECCFYAAEELHAYLSGECVECVGCSNNTIRAALTPKYIDRENLINILNYRMTKPDFYLLKPRQLDNFPHVLEFDPIECEDFKLHQIEIPFMDILQNNLKFPIHIPALMCASIIVFIEGSAECEDHSKFSKDEMKKVKIQRGDIYYIPPNHTLKITSVTIQPKSISETISVEEESMPETRLLAYRTFSYQPGPDHSKRIIATKRSISTTSLLPLMKTNIIKEKQLINSYITTPTDYFKKDNNNKRIFDVESEMDGFI